MQIQIHTGHNIEGHEALATQVSGVVKESLSRLGDRITHVDVHLSDENSDKKGGDDDMRCMIEARLKGRQPIAVTHQAATLDQAVDGAADKLTRLIDSTLGRLHHEENHRTDPPLSSSINWQAIAFKRIHPEGNAIVSLRLIGFYGGAKLDRTQPLTLTTSLGQTLTAKDISSEISQDTPAPANVGEYDIKLALPQLQAEIPLQLTLPTIDGESVSLSVPSAAIQEWQTLISH